MSCGCPYNKVGSCNARIHLLTFCTYVLFRPILSHAMFFHAFLGKDYNEFFETNCFIPTHHILVLVVNLWPNLNYIRAPHPNLSFPLPVTTYVSKLASLKH